MANALKRRPNQMHTHSMQTLPASWGILDQRGRSHRKDQAGGMVMIILGGQRGRVYPYSG